MDCTALKETPYKCFKHSVDRLYSEETPYKCSNIVCIQRLTALKETPHQYAQTRYTRHHSWTRLNSLYNHHGICFKFACLRWQPWHCPFRWPFSTQVAAAVHTDGCCCPHRWLLSTQVAAAVHTGGCCCPPVWTAATCVDSNSHLCGQQQPTQVPIVLLLSLLSP